MLDSCDIFLDFKRRSLLISLENLLVDTPNVINLNPRYCKPPFCQPTSYLNVSKRAFSCHFARNVLTFWSNLKTPRVSKTAAHKSPFPGMNTAGEKQKLSCCVAQRATEASPKMTEDGTWILELYSNLNPNQIAWTIAHTSAGIIFVKIQIHSPIHITMQREDFHPMCPTYCPVLTFQHPVELKPPVPERYYNCFVQFKQWLIATSLYM